MTTINGGGPAFPLPAHSNSRGEQSYPIYGLSIRDWFAGQAFNAAWLAMDGGYYDGGNEEVARCAYQMADAMIYARNVRE